ncbi:F-box/WD repeat-containing protein pof10-like [Coffea eugenioides]|uniref:F-box/WD repeat-containing protein pof10-like n=1 Tax=Coffea eugenioides TaxID=49369 RepID=UPI000F6144B1|nr:F-box/WD repeat-containing protein pof10-like [Coffea eugenioides]
MGWGDLHISSRLLRLPLLFLCRSMERLPVDVCLKILSLLDHQNLATAQLVCRKWKILASDDTLWSNLFTQRWGVDHATFFAPEGSKLWKDVYAVQDRGDRVGLGLKIIREGDDYYLVHQGEIQRHLGSRRPKTGEIIHSPATVGEEEFSNMVEPSSGILDKILFFIGDLESASVHAKRSRVL